MDGWMDGWNRERERGMDGSMNGYRLKDEWING